MSENESIQYTLGYQDGFLDAKKQFETKDIRWTDKLSIKSNGDIIDFEGRVVGHIDLEVMKGGTE